MSFIYSNIYLYRIIMNLLYFGKYKRRFSALTALIENTDRDLVELCFGDIFIAAYCKKMGKTWIGYDMNTSFVAHAVSKGFQAHTADLVSVKSLPSADVCILAGSLYHFHDSMDQIFSLMMACAPKIIISEPVKNFTSQQGLIGKIAAFLSNAGKGSEFFRYSHDSFIQNLDYYKKKYKFKYEILSEGKDLLIKIIHERN
jgi:hypothetical protein